MVDVREKIPTCREAKARAQVHLGREIMDRIQGGDIAVAKGSVFQTAILAGTMAVKKTSDLIPLCHPLAINGCRITIQRVNDESVEIICSVNVEGKTGVEMEALTGASIAALTVYDMCKAMSHHITIDRVQLISKTGGKEDFQFEGV